MAGKKNSKGSGEKGPADYRHAGEKRKNIPPAKIAAEGKVPAVPKAKYYYSPHLSPVLRFDPTGRADKLPSLVAEAAKRPLSADEIKLLSQAISVHEPWLEWSGKREEHERRFFEVDPVALHIHERVSTQAIVRAAMRKDVQRTLFADPEQPYQEAIQFYRHDVDWANRLILGDSLQVMSSLARRENLAGKVQMIYMDPPYGVAYNSNFQPRVDTREMKDGKDESLTREPEQVRAYRDTWTLGVHSYVAYLRARLVLCRDLLSSTGSVFVQIGEENSHRVRCLLDDVFGPEQAVATIVYKSAVGLGARHLDAVATYIHWYARDIERLKSHSLFRQLVIGEAGATRYLLAEGILGEVRRLAEEEVQAPSGIPDDLRPFFKQGLTSRTGGVSTQFRVPFEGKSYSPTAGGWRTNQAGMARLIQAGRIAIEGNRLTFKRYFADFPATSLNNVWDDISGGIKSRSDPKVYVVQTSTSLVERCMLMATDPGDLVVDPTCGSGTTAFVAETWGRRWITIDTSRVAVAIARQRLLTGKFEYYNTRAGLNDPAQGFCYKTLSHSTLRSIAQNPNLDPIFSKHEPVLDQALASCNRVVKAIGAETRRKLQDKLRSKQAAEGKRAITDGDRRRWELPVSGGFEHWTVPFDTDADWPAALRDAVTAYRKAWRAKMDEVKACIEANAEQEELVNRPDVVNGVLRVSGPFSVEGVRPEELSLSDEGLFDPTPNETEIDGGPVRTDERNLHAYLTRMVQHLRADGVHFLDNKHRKFGRLDPLFESGGGSLIHAEGIWEEGDANGPNTVAIGFGPQYGPVTAQQVEELIRSSKRYDELVVAGFSFEAAASEVMDQQAHPKLRIHQAYIRPDLNPAMDGLLKDTPGSQLFTVFGAPTIEVDERDGKYVCRLVGVNIYDPLENTVRSSGAEKVAAWFLDQDYDGRCFCITQAFFPDQDAWEKIAKALGTQADVEAFGAFNGTTSLPFEVGKHRRIAVKVIDPRGNEVMAIRSLEKRAK